MTSIQQFYILKQKVLEKYQETYPYFKGTWQSFSSADIRNLIDLIEQKTKQTISEKWIYTHLKPKENQKLPRKDMLDILSVLVGFSGWDEFAHQNHTKKKIPFLMYGLIGFGLICVGILIWNLISKEENSINEKVNNKSSVSESIQPEEENEIKLVEKYTKDSIQDEEIKVFGIENKEKKPLKVQDSKVLIEENKKVDTVIIESAFYEEDTIVLDEQKAEIQVNPDQNVFLLKGFLKSDFIGWKNRKQQMNEMMANDIEAIVMLPNGLGAIALNKQEIINKLSFPTESLKKVEIAEVEYNEQKKIEKLILIQR